MSDFSERVANLSPAKLELLARRLKEKGGARTPSLARSERGYWCPLSYGQERLWFLSQLEPDNPAYNAPAALRLIGPLDAIALEKSIDEIVRRHEILRTSIAQVNDQPVQVISPAKPRKLPVIDVQTEHEVRRVFDEESMRSFDPRREQLFRITLLRLAEREHVLLLIMHHLISDGWSLAVFLRELSALYTSFTRGEAAGLRELPLQYGDFAAWQRERLRGETMDRQVEYWRARLAGNLSGLQLPTDYARPPVHTFNGARKSLAISEELTAGLQDLSGREGVTLFMTLLSAFKVLLHLQTGQDDVVVGTPIANRTQPQTENLIGFFINTLVLRTDLSGDPTFAELLRRVRETALGAYAHQDLPFEKLVEALQPRREMSRSPLFQVMFVLQNAPGEALQLEGLTLSGMESSGETVKFELMLELQEVGDVVTGGINYSRDLYEAETIGRLAAGYERVLQAVVTDAEQRVFEIDLLSDAERRQVIHEWNATAGEYAAGSSLGELFEAQAERSGEAVAVVFEGEELTYGELNRRANQLAHYLRAQGVTADDIIGVLLERSLELVVSLLGILKAGAAYLPLDPNYPPERLSFMLADARAPVLLTQASLLARLPAQAGTVLRLDADWPAVAANPETAPPVALDPRHPAYVIYTSGSTGTPKGVCIEHCSAVNFVQDQPYVSWSANETAIQIAPLAFDASCFEIWGSLLNGAKL